MWKVGTLLFTFLVLHQGQCQFYSNNFDSSAPDDIYLRHYWNWRTNTGPGQIWPPRPVRPERRDTEVTTDRDREPLGPDYKDPEILSDPDETPGAPDTGVIDVDVNGYPNGFPNPFPEIPDNSGFPDSANFPNYGASFPGFFNFFGSLRRQKPWWQGPNVCIDREESIEDEDEGEKKEGMDEDDIEGSFLASINLSSCRETPNKYECITKTNNRGVMKTFTVKYKCCYGFRRTKESPACTKLELKSLLDTVNDVGAIEFRKMIASSDLEDKLREDNKTIFVPRDQALNDFTEKMLEMNQVEIDIDPVRRRRDLRHALSSKDLVMNHIVTGFVDLVDIENEQVLKSDYKDSLIRLNIYPTTTSEKLVTANCVPVQKANNLAQNGIVHIIDGVITPGQYSIKQIIEESKKLTMLRKILQNPELAKLVDRKGPFTLLAPTDEAFEKLDTATKQKLTRGDACAINILKYHIIPHTICSAAISGNVTVHNAEGHLFNMERKENDDLIIEGNVKIVKSDVVASDGVIQLIDTLMLPESGLHITQALKKHNLTKFEQLIEDAGLAGEIDDLKNATVFVPTDEAIDESANILDAMKSDQDKLKDLVKYHILPGKVQSCDLTNNEMKQTSVDGQKLRVNLYSTLPLFSNIINRGTVNCARLVNFDEKSCGSIIHTVDKLLLPPTKSLLDTVNSDEQYSILAKLIKGTEVEEILKDDKQSITLLAPPNAVFDSIDEKELNVLLEDKKKANEVLKHHILTEILCCSGVGGQSWAFNSFVPTLAHQPKEIRRNSRHQVRIGKSTVTKCDTVATNGVLHEVNNVVFPSRNQYAVPGIGGLFMFEF
ncbi:midline fasciclin [Carabus blaptoides fortunei]